MSEQAGIKVSGTVIKLLMPEEAALRLQKKWEEKDPELLALFASVGIKPEGMKISVDRRVHVRIFPKLGYQGEEHVAILKEETPHGFFARPVDEPEENAPTFYPENAWAFER